MSCVLYSFIDFLILTYFCTCLAILSFFFFFLMIRRPPRSTLSSSSAASDVYKRQVQHHGYHLENGNDVRLEHARVAGQPDGQRSHRDVQKDNGHDGQFKHSRQPGVSPLGELA
eukprot:TRINITY_DN33179_c0_g1_i1.p1 TRINITY_DN33179_c0_g1~~TRINITY_DN33179_c0_g1_i1.p1  ORF type:complete len:114 (-),score=23.22 TRINITY_DN33179_c0_g1_i1:243-584(-)